jgi:hypothetical protein
MKNTFLWGGADAISILASAAADLPEGNIGGA